MIRVGINGFGRVGRAVFRINHANPSFRVVAANDIDSDVGNHAYLLKYDSTYGRFRGKVCGTPGRQVLQVDGDEIPFYAEQDIGNVPWEKHGVDVVIDASGVYDNVLASRQLVRSNAVRKVVVTHSPKNGVDITLIYGVNEHKYDPTAHHVVSSSICDANALAPVLAPLESRYGIDHGFVTTLHPWLSYQNLVDGSVRSVSSPGHFWKDFSLGRASTVSLIPKPTTLVYAVKQVLPDLAERLAAMSFRVPTGIVSASDVTLMLREPATTEEINALFRDAARSREGVIGYEEEAVVSIDFCGLRESVFVDGRWTQVRGDRILKLVLWYDNEWGYSHRVVDVVGVLAKPLEGSTETSPVRLSST